MKKIYKHQVIYLFLSTLVFLVGLFTLFFVIGFNPFMSIVLIIGGIGLDATVIVSIFEDRKQEKREKRY